jgi:hypothetical protein
MWLVFGACGRGFFLPKPASRLGSVTVGVPKVAAGESPAGLEEWPPPVAAVEGLPPAADAQGNLGPTFEFAPESPRSAEEPPSASDRSKGPCPREDSDGSSPAHDSATAQRPAGRPAVGDWFRVYHLNAEAVVVEALGERIDERAAAALGALCRELLPSPRRRVLFDFSGASELATVALGILVRFRNSAVYLDKRVHLIVARPLRAELEEAHVDRILDLQDSLYPFLAPRVRLVEEYGPRSPEPGGGKPGRTQPKPATLAGRMWAALPERARPSRGGRDVVSAAGAFRRSCCRRASFWRPSWRPSRPPSGRRPITPTPSPRSPNSRRCSKTRPTSNASGSSWSNSASAPLDEPRHPAGQLLAALLLLRPLRPDAGTGRQRRHLRRRLRLGLGGGAARAAHAGGPRRPPQASRTPRPARPQARRSAPALPSAAQAPAAPGGARGRARTAELKWERVRLGLELMERLDPPPVAFDPIDRAEALQRLEQIDTERRRVEVDVAAVEAEMLGILGRRDFAP